MKLNVIFPTDVEADLYTPRAIIQENIVFAY